MLSWYTIGLDFSIYRVVCDIGLGWNVRLMSIIIGFIVLYSNLMDRIFQTNKLDMPTSILRV